MNSIFHRMKAISYAFYQVTFHDLLKLKHFSLKSVNVEGNNWLRGHLFPFLATVMMFKLLKMSSVSSPFKQKAPTMSTHCVRSTQRQFSENICSKDDLRSRIFGAFVVKFLACLPLPGFSNI